MQGLSLPDGTPTGGVYGFTSLAFEVIKRLNPDYVVVAWDKPKTNIRKRLEIYSEYKAGRKPAPPDFYAQIPILKDLLSALGWPFFECDDYEADDIMGTLSKQANDVGIETYLISSDLDMLQIVDHDTKMYALKKGLSSIEEFDVKHFEEKYGIKINQFLDLKALKGDSSDNIPGVPGIGEKTATTLLKQYGTLDGIYERLDEITPTGVQKKLREGKELAYMSKELSKIWTDAPVELNLGDADIHNLDHQKLLAELKKLEFNSLIRRLPKEIMLEKNNQEQQAGLFDSEVKNKVNLKFLDSPNIGSEGDLLVCIVGDEVFGSADQKSFFKIELSNGKVFRDRRVVTYDAKYLYHFLNNNFGYNDQFADCYDIAQASFLLNPLFRDHSISTLVAEEVDMNNPAEVLAALYQIKNKQESAFKNNIRLEKVATELDFPLTYVLYKMEELGIKIDVDFFEKMSENLAFELSSVEKQIYDLVGREFNINSPTQLSEVLFVDLGLPVVGIKKSARGYSTGQKELDKLRGHSPVIELVERVRELSKLKSTYLDALPKLTDQNSKIHTTFTQNVTATGRLSSINPNLQNIPIRTELGKKIREGFVAGEGNIFVSADYSQFELRLAAVLSDDKKLINDFNEGVDIHTKTASDVFGVDLDQVTKDQRRAAKVINFGVLYGMSPNGLSQATGMNYVEAREFIEKYFELRAPIRKYIDEVLERAKADGFVETYFGRRRPTPDINSSNYLVREAAKRAAANMPIQGTEADLMKRAMIRLEPRLKGIGNQILQIHDSILVECPEQNSEQVASILRDTMESIAPEFKIKLDVDVSIGKNWGEL